MPILQLGDVEAIGLRWAGDDFVLARVAYWEQVGARGVYRLERNVTITPQARPSPSCLEAIRRQHG